MATLGDREAQGVATKFTQLASSAEVAIVIIAVFGTAQEVFRRTRRNAYKDKPATSIEDFGIGYVYWPRSYYKSGRKLLGYSKYPLGWAWTAIRTPSSFYADYAGLDAATYVRFLHGCWLFMLSQMFTTFLILVPLHVLYAPEGADTHSIDIVAATQLVNDNGKSVMWVHVFIIWWICICWTATVLWIGWGNISMRRKQVVDLAATENVNPADESRGWRFRTIKMSNIPAHLRSERALIEYVEHCLKNLKSADPSTNDTPQHSTPTLSSSAQLALPPPKSSIIDNVYIVRRTTQLHERMKKREEVCNELEAAHGELARSVMEAVRKRAMERINHKPKPIWHLHPRTPEVPDVEKTAEKLKAIDELVDRLASFLPLDAPGRDQAIALSTYSAPSTIWEALAKVPAEHLDAYQPVIKLKFFKNQVAPSIDYHVAKLNLLTALIEDLRAKPEKFAPTSTAFITFKQASDARLLKREMGWIRSRALTCQISMAPDVRDIEWDRLVVVHFAHDAFRSIVTNIIFWAITILWILPIGILLGLLSIKTIAEHIPALAAYLDRHTGTKNLLSSLIPTVLVALIQMLIPTLTILGSEKGQVFTTMSKLHHAVLCRYWKWLILNVLIMFCVGTAAFRSVLTALQIPSNSSDDEPNQPVLEIVSKSFASGATFFVSWQIVVCGTQNFFEFAQFMIPWFMWTGVRKARSPRERFRKTLPRRFFAYNWTPQHLLVIAISCVFGQLNPLVFVFAMVYFTLACMVLKNNFLHVYWRVYYELNGRLIYTRVLRYSLDALVLAEVVAMAYFFVNKQAADGGAVIALIPITVFIKLAATRWYHGHMNSCDDLAADIICGQSTADNEVETEGEASNSGSIEQSERGGFIMVRKTVAALPQLTLWPLLKLKTFTRASHWKSKVNNNAANAVKTFHPPPPLDGQDLDTRQASPMPSPPNPSEKLNPVDELMEKRLSTMPSKPSLRVPPRQLIITRPPLDRNDEPDFSAKYENPYLAQELQQYLWLPRDPLKPIHLDDTVEYHGNMLVSSEGGDGRHDSDQPFSAMSQDVHMSLSEKQPQHRPSLTPSIRSGRDRLRGDEKVQIARDLQDRLDKEATSSLTFLRTTSPEPMSIMESISPTSNIPMSPLPSTRPPLSIGTSGLPHSLTAPSALRSASDSGLLPPSDNTDFSPTGTARPRRAHSAFAGIPKLPTPTASTFFGSRRPSALSVRSNVSLKTIPQNQALFEEIMEEERKHSQILQKKEEKELKHSKAKPSWLRRMVIRHNEGHD